MTAHTFDDKTTQSHKTLQTVSIHELCEQVLVKHVLGVGKDQSGEDEKSKALLITLISNLEHSVAESESYTEHFSSAGEDVAETRQLRGNVVSRRRRSPAKTTEPEPQLETSRITVAMVEAQTVISEASAAIRCCRGFLGRHDGTRGLDGRQHGRVHHMQFEGPR